MRVIMIITPIVRVEIKKIMVLGKRKQKKNSNNNK